MFMLVGVLILLPIILGYTVFNYWVFRGKVRAARGLPLSRARRADAPVGISRRS